MTDDEKPETPFETRLDEMKLEIDAAELERAIALDASMAKTYAKMAPPVDFSAIETALEELARLRHRLGPVPIAMHGHPQTLATLWAELRAEGITPAGPPGTISGFGFAGVELRADPEVPMGYVLPVERCPTCSREGRAGSPTYGGPIKCPACGGQGERFCVDHDADFEALPADVRVALVALRFRGPRPVVERAARDLELLRGWQVRGSWPEDP